MRQIKLGSYVQIVVDKDRELLIGRKGNVTSINNDKFWVKLDNHPIALPFSADEIQAVNRPKKKK